MCNELLFFISVALSFSLILVAYRYFGKLGVFAWISFASVVANIEVVKCIDLFGLSVTLGNVVYASNFLATDILSEMYGGKESRKAVRISFFTLICATLLMQCSLLFTPNSEDFASGAMKTIFSLAPRICIVSLASFIISNTLDTYLYDWIGKFTKKVWVKNNLATMTTQLLDSFLFTYGAFYGVFPNEEVFELVLTTYAIKWIIAVLDTPFLYAAKWIYNNKLKYK